MLPLFRRFCLAAIFASAGVFAADTAPAPATPAAPSLTVAGKIDHPLALSIDALRHYPPEQIAELQLPGRTAGDPVSKMRGVRLKALLEQAKVVASDHNTVKKIAVIATARDGYTVVFSWSELFNSEAGDSVLVLFERDGKALSDDEGPLALISGRDIRTGPRHVKWLQRIEVRQIAD